MFSGHDAYIILKAVSFVSMHETNTQVFAFTASCLLPGR